MSPRHLTAKSEMESHAQGPRSKDRQELLQSLLKDGIHWDSYNIQVGLFMSAQIQDEKYRQTFILSTEWIIFNLSALTSVLNFIIFSGRKNMMSQCDEHCSGRFFLPYYYTETVKFLILLGVWSHFPFLYILPIFLEHMYCYALVRALSESILFYVVGVCGGSMFVWSR